MSTVPAYAAEQWEEEIELLDLMSEVLVEKRQYREALEALGKTFNEYTKSHGAGHPATALAENLLARFLLRIHSPVAARGHALGAIAHMESALGASTIRLVPLLTDLAQANEHIGDWQAARTAIDRARAIVEKTAPQSGRHALVLRQSARIALASFAQDLFPHLEDLQHASRIIGANEKLAAIELAPALELAADYVIRIAPTIADAGARRKLLEDARARMLDVLQYRSKTSREDDFALINPLHRLAVIARDLGDYTQAERYFMSAMMQIMKQKPGNASFPAGSATLIRDAIIMDVRRKRHALLPGFCQMLLERMEDLLAVRLDFAEDEEQVRIAEALRNDFSFCFEVVRQTTGPGQHEAARRAMDWVIRAKAIVLDVQAHVLRAARATPGGMTALAELNALKHAAARAPAAGGGPGATQAKINALQLRLAQMQLARSAKADMDDVIGAVKLDDVARALPRNSALIEFMLVPEFDFAQARPGNRKRYLAFVMGHEKTVQMIDLGDASIIDAAIHDANKDIRAVLNAGTPSQQIELHARAGERLAALYHRVWQPLTGALGSVQTVVLSPDGELNLAPFAALASGTGAPLIERHSILYVTTGRDIARGAAKSQPPELELLLIADPAFDLAPGMQGKDSTRLRALGLQLGTFEPLPGTAQEARELPGLVPGPPARKRIVTGPNASAGALAAAQGPRVLHIATHGFFLPGAGPLQNPLLRSGLAFAGANRADGDFAGNGGIMTAYEITGLDLRTTELAVLSACDTGIGVIGAGEGVFGLRRAFVLAGARTLMMSLWPVADDITAQQMRSFYDNRRNMSAMQALRAAQLETIKSLKAKSGIAPAVFWAPFFIQGGAAFNP